jgi:hypothetical protein
VTEKPWLWPALIVASAVAAVAFVLIGWDHPLRSLVVLWFLCVIPGLAVLHPLELPDPVTGLALVVPLSLAIDALVAGILVYAGVWSPHLAIMIVAVLSIAALGLSRPLASHGRDEHRSA